MADKKQQDERGWDIWDVVLPAGGALIGGKLGKVVLNSTRKGRHLGTAVRAARGEEEISRATLRAERKAKMQQLRELQDAPYGDGPELLSPESELRIRRYFDPKARSPALNDLKTKRAITNDAVNALARHNAPGAIAGLAGGGYAGVKANEQRRKKR